MTATAGRLTALGRAELTLLLRNRTALCVALLMPGAMVVGTKSSLDQIDPDQAGMSAAEAAMTGGIGMVLILVVHLNLVSAYVARREELVLKRLRTGEASDIEILTGGALPSVVIALAQCALLLVGGAVLLDLSAPERPELVAAGVLLGVVMMVLLAAASAAFTRTTEAAQITSFPFMAISFVGSGVVVPLDVMPDQLANICLLLPVSPLMELVRGGWVGTLSGVETLKALGIAALWTVLGVLAVRRWFRWEPRR
jgi:ABC-2 type transport system permease protein